MSNETSVPSLRSVKWDVSCSFEDNSSFSPSSCCSSSPSPSSCQVSSSSAVQQKSKAKKKHKQSESPPNTFPHHTLETSTNNDVESLEDRAAVVDESVDDSPAVMGLDATPSYKSRNSHRRVSSPHPDGTTKKSNKPQMERRRRQRINDSVNELRKIIPEVFKVDPSRHEKLEKADILELTVKYFHFIRSRRSVEESGSQYKPIRLEEKGMNGGDFSGKENLSKYERPITNHNSSAINEQPLTLIIQTLPHNFQRDHQYLVGYNSNNSFSAQPQILSNQSPPLIQFNITNNITKPIVDTFQTYPSQVLPDSVFSSPDTTTVESQQDIIAEQNISFKEEVNYQHNGYISGTSNKATDKQSSTNYTRGFELSTEGNSGRRFSLGRPIAPKAPKRKENLSQINDMPQLDNQNVLDEVEQVWRPWDVTRKDLKPHFMQ